jgi:hypothetical protein
LICVLFHQLLTAYLPNSVVFYSIILSS